MAGLQESLSRIVSKTFSALGKEQSALEELHEESNATVHRMVEEDPGLRGVLDKAHAYAVFPSVGKATAVVGGAFGKGEVFQGDQLIGYAGLVQVTLGVQLGGQTFSELVVFENEEALERFKQGKAAFAANASAVLVKAGAAASKNYDSGARVFVSSEGGMMLEAAIGAQKFIFKPAALGRAKEAPRPVEGAADASTKARPEEKQARSGGGKKPRPAARRAKPTGSRPKGSRTPKGRRAGKARAQSAKSGGPTGSKRRTASTARRRVKR